MTKRRAFTLVELIIAVFIFSYIAASLSTIYSTANRHMFQNYRRNVIKTSLLVSMRDIQNNLARATRIDLPAPGGQGNTLAFAINIDRERGAPAQQGCYPVNAAVQTSWHYFCRAADPLVPGTWILYHHTGVLAGGTPCGNPGQTTWSGAYPVPTCGANIGGQTVTLLMRGVAPAAGYMFSRSPADGIDAVGSVRVMLRSFWSASGRGFGSAQRDVDASLDSVFTSSLSQ